MTHDEIKKRFQSIQSVYRHHFAGHPRASRDVGRLQTILADLERLLEQPINDHDLQSDLRKALESYRSELPRVLTAKAGPKSLEIARAVGWLQLTIARYRRGFAGQSRETRNPHRLRHILGDMRARKDQLERFVLVDRHNSELAAALRNGDQQCQVYETEITQIENALDRGEALDKVKRFVDLEATQWQTYRESFAGKSRGSRNLSILTRLHETTDDLLSRTDRLHKGDPQHTAHLRAMREHAELYKKERAEVSKTQKELPAERRMGELGGAANQCFESYRNEFAGTPRTSVDPDRLDRILEDLYGFAQQMEALQLPAGSNEAEQNQRNLQIVLDRMRIYDREHQQIVAAQAKAVH